MPLDFHVVQKSGVHRLRLVVYPYGLQGLISSQVVVWDFFHQEYLHTFLVKFHRDLTNRPGPPISIADVSGNGTPKFQGNLIPFGQKPCLSIYLLYIGNYTILPNCMGIYIFHLEPILRIPMNQSVLFVGHS